MDQPPFSFRARGPIEVTGEPGDLVPLQPGTALGRDWRTPVVFVMSWLGLLTAGSALSDPLTAGVLATGIAIPTVMALRHLWSPAIHADRSGLKVGRELWSWDDVTSVRDDLVRWRIENDEGQHSESFQHAVVVTRNGLRFAFWVRSQARAEEIAAKLAFFARQQSGRPDDVPEELRKVAKAPKQRA
ncbi:MAG: hypothetical protein R3F61_14035 [Myxococcota bacterium]